MITSAIVAVSVCLVGTVYDPYGPFNSTNTLSYNLPSAIYANSTVDATLGTLLGLVPMKNPNLLLQNNMPEAYPRPLGNNGLIMITGETLAYNLTYLYDGRWVTADIDFVLTDPWDYTFSYQAPFPYNLTMEDALRELYASGDFGIMGEADGLMLLGRSYSGPLEYYIPNDEEVPASQLHVTDPAFRSGTLVSANNVTNHTTVWYGPSSLFLPPGLYNISYELKTTNSSSTNRLLLDAYDEVGGSLVRINSTPLTGNELSPEGTWVNVTTQVYFNNFEPSMDFSGDDVSWSGGLSLRQISITQVAEPSTSFVIGLGPPYAVT